MVEILEKYKRRCSENKNWTDEMNEKLFDAIDEYGLDWERIGKIVGKTP